jgi:hypothetical protein
MGLLRREVYSLHLELGEMAASAVDSPAEEAARLEVEELLKRSIKVKLDLISASRALLSFLLRSPKMGASPSR